MHARRVLYTTVVNTVAFVVVVIYNTVQAKVSLTLVSTLRRARRSCPIFVPLLSLTPTPLYAYHYTCSWFFGGSLCH